MKDLVKLLLLTLLLLLASYHARVGCIPIRTVGASDIFFGSIQVSDMLVRSSACMVRENSAIARCQCECVCGCGSEMSALCVGQASSVQIPCPIRVRGGLAM